MSRLKKMLALVLALAMVVSMAACGSKKGSNESEPDGTKGTEGTEASTTGEDNPGGGMLTIHSWHPQLVLRASSLHSFHRTLTIRTCPT